MNFSKDFVDRTVFSSVSRRCLLLLSIPVVFSACAQNDTTWSSLPYLNDAGNVCVTDGSGRNCTFFELDIGNEQSIKTITMEKFNSSANFIVPCESGDFLGYALQLGSTTRSPSLKCFNGGTEVLKLPLNKRTSRVSLFPKMNIAICVVPEKFGFSGHEVIEVLSFEGNGKRRRFTSRTIIPDYAVGSWHLGSAFSACPSGNWFALTTQDGRPNVWFVDESSVKLQEVELDKPMGSKTGLVWTDVSRESKRVLTAKSLLQPGGEYEFEVSIWSLTDGHRLYSKNASPASSPVAAALIGQTSFVYCTNEHLCVVDVATGRESRIKRGKQDFVPVKLLVVSPEKFLLIEEQERSFKAYIETSGSVTQLSDN